MSRDALVVGVSTYQWLPNLGAPAHDAEAIAQRLQTDGEFRVVRMPEIIQSGQSKVGVKTPVTLAELETALVRLFKPKGNNIPQTALFYFSGHGLQKDAGIQEGYLATSDANPSAGFYGLSLFWLRRLLQESPVRQRIILLDCCHSGELLNYLEADPGARAGTDRLFMAASREYEAAYESISGKYSVFTQALLDGLDPNRLPNGTVTNYALTDAVSTALKAEPQQPLFENSGSEIILTRSQGSPTIIKTELQPEICPYRGLECFDEAHAEFFFGREDLTDQLIEKLKSRNFVAVVGASGSGKSSLVRAGLIHQLRQGHKFSGSDRWRIQLITPTDQPLKSLASAFVNSKAPTVDRAEHLRRAETLLREGGNGLAHLVRASLISSKYGRNTRLLLIIDQFEEVFTLCQGPNAERDRHRFFNSLLAALREAGDCLSIVIVLRADFFGKCSLYNGLAEQIEQNLITATPLTYEQIKSSVVKPAQKAGLVCDPNLVYNILLDVVGAPGELPLLQYTLLELWRQRQPDPNGGPSHLTLDAYTELGGVRGTLQKRANDIFYSLSPEEQQVAKRIFIALTQFGDGTEDTRRRILKSELVSPRFSAELVERVLEKLVTAKLVVTNRIAPLPRHQERVDQGIANVSSALRLAQMCQGKVRNSNKLDSEVLTTLQTTAITNNQHLINRITQQPAHRLPELKTASGSAATYQETIDVAHEALIRNWTLLRTWLDENREMLRRQRRIEHSAREWFNADEPKSPEYLLHGDRLIDAEEYLKSYPDELSALAQRFISISREESRRTRKELRLLQMIVPCTLLVALGVTFNQYLTAVKSQAEKNQQLQIATSRQQAAVAQSILQEPDGDPTTALLISRLAAEQGGQTYEAQASLRAALQKLQLQSNLVGHTGAVTQLVFSPNGQRLATAGVDGSIRLWSPQTQALEQILQWEAEPGKMGANRSANLIQAIAFSPDSTQLAAIAKDTPVAQVWSATTGKMQFKLAIGKAAITKLVFSPQPGWVATASSDNMIQLWQTSDGTLRSQSRLQAPVTSLNFSPNGQWLLVASGNTVQIQRATNQQVVKVLNHTTQVTSATFSPDGQWIATTSNDGKVRLWQVRTGRLQYTINHHPAGKTKSLVPVESVMFSPNGQFFATRDRFQQIQLWQTNSGELITTFASGGNNVTCKAQKSIVFSPDSRRLGIVCQQVEDAEAVYTLQMWDTTTGHMLTKLGKHTDLIHAVQFSPDGALVATASADGSVRLWSAVGGSEFPTLKMPKDQIRWVAFRGNIPNTATRFAHTTAAIARPETSTNPTVNPLPVGGMGELVTVSVDGTVYNWHLPNQQNLAHRSSKPTPAVIAATANTTLALNRQSTNFLQRFNESIWSFGNRLRPQFQQPDQETSQTDQATTIVSTLFLNTSQPARAKMVSANSGQPSADAASTTNNLVRMSSLKAQLSGVAFSANTGKMAIATAMGDLEIWQMQPDGNMSRIHSLEQPQSTPNMDISDNGNSDLASTKVGDHKTIHHFAFSTDERMLLGINNRQIYLWDVESGKFLRSFQGHEAAIAQANFSADGQLIVSASRDRTARIWEVASGKLINTLFHRDVVSSAQFSPDGTHVVTASWDGTARVLDVKTGVIQVILTGHNGAILHAEFSPDGRTLVTASMDGSARLWDAQTGTEQALLRPLEASQDPIQQAFFSPDGRYVATLNQRGQLNVWTATWEGLLDLARHRSMRQLQAEECLRYLRLPPASCPALNDTTRG